MQVEHTADCFGGAWFKSPLSTERDQTGATSSGKQRLILGVSGPSISQRSQIKEDTVELSVPAREFNLKAYAVIT